MYILVESKGNMNVGNVSPLSSIGSTEGPIYKTIDHTKSILFPNGKMMLTA